MTLELETSLPWLTTLTRACSEFRASCSANRSNCNNRNKGASIFWIWPANLIIECFRSILRRKASLKTKDRMFILLQTSPSKYKRKQRPWQHLNNFAITLSSRAVIKRAPHYRLDKANIPQKLRWNIMRLQWLILVSNVSCHLFLRDFVPFYQKMNGPRTRHGLTSKGTISWEIILLTIKERNGKCKQKRFIGIQIEPLA